MPTFVLPGAHTQGSFGFNPIPVLPPPARPALSPPVPGMIWDPQSGWTVPSNAMAPSAAIPFPPASNAIWDPVSRTWWTPPPVQPAPAFNLPAFALPPSAPAPAPAPPLAPTPVMPAVEVPGLPTPPAGTPLTTWQQSAGLNPLFPFVPGRALPVRDLLAWQQQQSPYVKILESLFSFSGQDPTAALGEFASFLPHGRPSQPTRFV